MRLTSALALLALAFGDASCAAADKSPLEAEDERRGTRLSDFVDNFLDMPEIKPLFRREDGQCEFTKRLKTRALLQYRDFNVVVYSNLKASDNELVNKICAPVDVQHAVWPQQMYKLCVFQSGRFTRVGDDKCENWQCGGCAMELYGSTVQFCRVQPTTTPSRTTTSKPPGTAFGTIRYGAGSRKSTSSTSKGLPKTSNKAATKTSITAASSRPRGTTTTRHLTTSSQPVLGTTATDTSTTHPPSPTTTTPPVLPPTSAAGGGNAGADTTGVPRAAGSTNEPAIVGVLAAMGMVFMAVA